MWSSLLIGTVSATLLGYWFRYSCLLLLRSRADRAVVASEYQFNLFQVRDRIKTDPVLDVLHQSLERDYHILNYLLQHTALLGGRSLEDRILLLDYAVMRGWYRLTRNSAPERARVALSEMAAVLVCLAQKLDAKAGLRI